MQRARIILAAAGGRENKDIAVKLLWCFVQVLNQRLRITNDDLKQALAPLELDSMFNDED